MSEEEPEVEYIADEGFVRLNLRRPINLYVPTDQKDSYDPEAEHEGPSAKLELEWVYGYRGRDCRNNILALASGEIVYFCAAVAVVYNLQEKTQRQFLHHTDDIKCIAVHPDGKTVATGQIKGRDENLPHVCVWDSESLEVLHSFGSDTFNRGVSVIAFSKDGSLIAAVDDAPEPRLSIWNWEDESMENEVKVASDPVLGVTFSNEDPSRIVTSGKNHLGFWTIEDASKKTGIFGSYEKPKYVTSVASLPNGDVITGDSNGNILLWKQGGNTVTGSVAGAHEGSVFYLHVMEDGNVLSAGKDGKIVMYNSELEPTGESTQIPPEYGAPRVVLKLGDSLIAGTTNNSIVETNFEGDLTTITQGHLEELWGLAVDPSEPNFVTAGQDGRVFYRDTSSHGTIWRKVLEMACQSADISNNGAIIVIGGHTGKWAAIEKESQDVVFEGLDGEEPIQVIRFSPDDSKLAIGSRDNNIYIYNVEEEGKKYSLAGVLEGHSSFITHLDWSSDGQMIRSNSGDYEVLFWKIEDLSMETQNEEYRDVEWSTNNCVLSFDSIGIWPPGTDGTHINCCNKGHAKPLIASGDDFGMLKLFAYPSVVHNAKHEKYLGHSSHITTVCFDKNDSLVFSAGGRDCTTMQWKIIDG